ncbi:MAG: DDE-type integrase/transposase/recombinase [Candidatus Micrarchaeota archaeon]
MTPVIEGRVHVDEKFIHVGKKHGYDLNAIDSKTKYVLAHSYVVKRTIPACVKFLRQVKTTCYRQILEVYRRERHKPAAKRNLIIFVSDGFQNYRNAFNKLFYRTCTLRFGVSIACRKYGLEHNNNAIERYNGDIEDRTKTMRDFGSHQGAGGFLDMKQVIHNFVNPHMSLKGRTPAEAARVEVNLGRKKLFYLVRFLAKKTHHSLR